MSQPADNTTLTITPASANTTTTTITEQQQKQMPSGTQQQQPSVSPSRRDSFDIDLEDGPLFRAIIKEHEGKTSTLKGHLKRILKAAQALSDAKHHLLEQDQLFIEVLREAPFTEPLFTHYLDCTWEKLHEQQERLYFCMQNILIDPLRKLYEMDIKSVDAKRKRFEDISKDYYSALAKYLSKKSSVHDTPSGPLPTTLAVNDPSKSLSNSNASNGNVGSSSAQQQTNNINLGNTLANSIYQTTASTSKSLRQKRNKKTELEFHVKKSEFDLVRFEYYSFLRDLHGGKKEQEILYHLLHHNEKQYSYFQAVVKILEPHKAGLEELARLIAEASKEQKIVNQERDEIRKILASKNGHNDGTTCNSNISNNNNNNNNNSSSSNKRELKRKSLLTSISPPVSSMSVFSSSSYPKLSGGGLALSSSPASPEITSEQQPFFADYNASTNNIVIDAANYIDSSRPNQQKNDKFKGIRDLEQQNHALLDSVGRKKEGFLFATSKPIKNIKNNANSSLENVIWHKYWCVVSGGQLHEYSKWKKHLETHLEPIDLRFATVRENKNVERRFCFEVITPKFKRLYQATSEEELTSWIATINNAINSLLNGSSDSAAHLERLHETSKKSWKQTATFSGALSGLAAAKNKYLRKRSHSNGGRRLTAAGSRQRPDALSLSPPPLAGLFDQHELSTPQPSSSYKSDALVDALEINFQGATLGSQTDDDRNKSKLLDVLQQDSSNCICADCSAKNPEWCSINLGIVLCIECSGIHRSLGTHISKVRSLTLDQTSFTPEIIQLMLSMGNAKSNNIWEAKLLSTNTNVASADDNSTTDTISKLVPNSPRDVKLAYIRQKYVMKAFVNDPPPTTEGVANDPMNILYDAIADDDIPLAMYAIALGADVNKQFPASCYDTHNPISLLSPYNNKQPTFITLPSLDAEGHVKGTISLPCPPFVPPLLLPNNDEGKMMKVDTLFVRYPLHLALIGLKDQTSYPMAEFLLLNGASMTVIDEAASGCRLGDLIAYGELVEDSAIAFLNTKNNLRGDALIERTSIIPSSATTTTTT